MVWNPRSSELCGDIPVQAPHAKGILNIVVRTRIAQINKDKKELTTADG